jgi:O-antigen/teichoic acid export membrane protein
VTRAGRAIARNLGWLLASRGVLAVLSLVYLAIATRMLGVTNFGRFSLIVGAATTLATIVGFQTWQIIVQFGTRHLPGDAGPGDPGKLARVVRGCLLLDAASAMVGVVLAYVILSIWAEDLGIAPTLERATLIFTAVELLTIRSTAIGILRMRDRFSSAALADSVTPAARLVGATIVAIVHPTVQAFLAAWGAAELLTAAAYWITVWRGGDGALLKPQPTGLRTVLAENPGLLRFALTSNLISTLWLSTKQLPLLLTGATLGTASAGAFRLAAQIASSLTKLSQLLTRAAFPEIVKAVTANGVAGLGPLMRRSFLIATAVAAVGYLVLLLIGKPVLAIMGAGFGASYPILLWLAAAGCIDLMAVGFEPLLMAAHRTAGVAIIRLAGAAMLVALALVLAPAWGATGVAAGVVANAAIVAAMLALLLGHTLRRADALPTPAPPRERHESAAVHP